MPQQRPPATWNADQYARSASFVADMGDAVVKMLAPKPGERILDLGCGDGRLTERLAAMGADVVGVDASREMVEAARKRGLDARVMPAESLVFENEFDAVFSNAALHWVLHPARALAGIHFALKPRGRFVAEFGGAGNVALICEALTAAMDRRGHSFQALSPWYFPSPTEYSALLRAAGFSVQKIGLHERPTPQPGDIGDWLALFASSVLSVLEAVERDAAVNEMREMLRPKLCDQNGVWTVDYVRLRLLARREG